MNLFRHANSSWDPPVVTVSGLKATGMDRIWAIVQDHRSKLEASGALDQKRRTQQQTWFWNMINDGLKEHFLGRSDVKNLLPKMEAAVADGKVTPTEAARRLLALLDIASQPPDGKPRRQAR